MRKTHSCRLEIGRSSFMLHWSSGAIQSLYAPFTVTSPSESGDAHYSMAERSPLPAPSKKTYWSGPSWRMTAGRDGIAVDVVDPHSQRWQCAAEMDETFSCGVFYPLVAPVGSCVECLYPPVDRVVFANRLSIEGTVLVHASAVRINEGVYLFCGRSGIGKSTIAQLWLEKSGCALLNDDRAVVFCKGRNAWAGAAPWHGKNPAVDPAAGPLRAIFHLGHASNNRLRRLDPSVAVARLLATGVIPFYYEPSVAAAMDAITEVCSAAPSFDLDFYPDADVLDFVAREVGL